MFIAKKTLKYNHLHIKAFMPKLVFNKRIFIRLCDQFNEENRHNIVRGFLDIKPFNIEYLVNRKKISKY